MAGRGHGHPHFFFFAYYTFVHEYVVDLYSLPPWIKVIITIVMDNSFD